MSFWRTFGFNVSAVETILEKESFTLEDLLDEEEILQETKAQNKKLLDFVTNAESLKKLVTYVTEEPGSEEDNKRAFKYPFVACEILCSDVWQICDAVYKNAGLLDKLYSFLDRETISPILLSYSSRVCGVLLQRKIPETIQYLQKKDGVVAKFVEHLSSSAVMELLLKIIACEDTVEGSGVLKWLSESNLISSLVEKFHPRFGEEVHENVSQALLDIINISMSNSNSPLIVQLESEGVVKIIDFAIEEKSTSSTSVLLQGLNVINELLRRNIGNAPDKSTPVENLPALLKALAVHLHKFYDILSNPVGPEVLTGSGLLKPAFGFARLKVLELFLSLLRTKYACIDQEIVKLKIFNSCLDTFFNYPQNNFVHHTVEHMISIVLEGHSSALIDSLFKDADILTRIANANKDHVERIKRTPSAPRHGYIGFTTAISGSIEKAAKSIPQIADYCQNNETWQEFTKGILAKIREAESRPLGGAKVFDFPSNSSSEGEESDSVFANYRFTENFASNIEDVEDEEEGDEFDEQGEFNTNRNFEEMSDSSSVDEDELLSDSDDSLETPNNN